MIIRNAKKEDIGPFNDLASYCFGNPYEKHSLYDEIFDLEDTKIVEEDGKLVGGYTLYPFEMTYCDTRVKMGGLSCVVMDVGARYNGKAKQMLTEMISDMYEKDYVFSTLGAFNFGFYRKLGWEIAYDKMWYQTDIEIFKPYLTHEYEVKKYYKIPYDKIIQLQNDFAKKYNGYIPRDIGYWTVFEKILEDGKYLTATVSKNGSVEGYIIYNLSDRKFSIREIVYSNIDSLKALFGFIYRHNAQRDKVTMKVPCDFPLRLLVDDLYKVEAKLEPFMMNRIVDVKKAFELGEYPNIGEHSLSVKITDTIADWNDGVWHLYLSQGNIRAEKGSNDDNFDAEITIHELSRMIIGYAGGKELLDIGKINAFTQEAGDFICEVFINKPTYINNMY